MEDYLSGLSTCEIGMKFGVHHKTVNSILERNNVQRRRQPMSPEEIKEAVALYLQGRSANQISEKLNRPPSTLVKALRRQGVKIRTRVSVGQLTGTHAD